MPWINFNKQKNFKPQFLSLTSLVVILITLPLLVLNVQQRQEIRKMAAQPIELAEIIQPGAVLNDVYPPEETPNPTPTSSAIYIPGVGIVNLTPTPKVSAPATSPTPTPKPTSSVIYIPGVGIVNPTPTTRISTPTSTPTPTPKPASSGYYVPGGFVKTEPTPTPKPNSTPIYIPGIGIVNQNTGTTKAVPTPTRKPTPVPIYIPGIGIVNQTTTGTYIPKPTPTPKPNYIYIPGIGVIDQNKTTPSPTPTPATIYVPGIGYGTGPSSTAKYDEQGRLISSSPNLVRYRCGTSYSCTPDFNGQYMGLESCQSLCKNPKPLLGEGSSLTSAKPGEKITDASYTPAEIAAKASKYDGEYYTGQNLMTGLGIFAQQGLDLLNNPWEEMKQAAWDPVYNGTSLNQSKTAQNINYAMDTMNQSWESPMVQGTLAVMSLGAASPYMAGKVAATGIEEALIQKVVQAATKTAQSSVQNTSLIDDFSRIPTKMIQDKLVFDERPQQLLEINPTNDVALQGFLYDVEKLVKDVPVEDRLPVLNNYVYNLIEYDLVAEEALYTANGSNFVKLGDFVCQGKGVCLEKSALLHTAAAQVGIETKMAGGLLGTGNHAWVEYIDNVTNQIMVVDPTWNFILPRQEAYSKLDVFLKTYEAWFEVAN